MAAWGNAKFTYTGNNAPKAVALKTTGDEPKILTPKESDLPKINHPKVIGATPSGGPGNIPYLRSGMTWAVMRWMPSPAYSLVGYMLCALRYQDRLEPT